MKHNAFAITSLGTGAQFLPNFERGDKETRDFAKESNRVMGDGLGVTLVIGDKASEAAINKAIALLETAKKLIG